jgi:hypothetical protein
MLSKYTKYSKYRKRYIKIAKMRVPGFDAAAFPTTGLGSLDSFIVRGFIDISTRGFPGFDVSAGVLSGLASSPASARAGCGRILQVVAGSCTASAASAAAASSAAGTGPAAAAPPRGRIRRLTAISGIPRANLPAGAAGSKL